MEARVLLGPHFLYIGLSTLIAPRVIAFVVLLTMWESLASMLFRCNHLMYHMLEILGSLWVIITEFVKLPLILDPVGKVLDHLSIYDTIDLGS